MDKTSRIAANIPPSNSNISVVVSSLQTYHTFLFANANDDWCCIINKAAAARRNSPVIVIFVLIFKVTPLLRSILVNAAILLLTDASTPIFF